jgi:putative flippase GtrA
MSVSSIEFGPAVVAAPRFPTPAWRGPLVRLIGAVPRPFRFLAVGGVGLASDLTVLTLVLAHWPHPLSARLISLAIATLVTWRLNRTFTFDRSGRPQAEEAMRYLAVTTVAQGTSYAVFAALVLTVLAFMPQAAAVAGATTAAAIAYSGHRLFAFRPRQTAPARSSR